MKDTMIYSLTGIAYEEMMDLSRHSIKTFELVCADHITIAQKLKKGDLLFISHLSKQDIQKGVDGFIGKVSDVKTDYWRTDPHEFDEKEVLSARIQVKYYAEGKITSIKDLGMGKGLQVSYDTHVMLG